jgi:hypothetical protein
MSFESLYRTNTSKYPGYENTAYGRRHREWVEQERGVVVESRTERCPPGARCVPSPDISSSVASGRYYDDAGFEVGRPDSIYLMDISKPTGSKVRVWKDDQGNTINHDSFGLPDPAGVALHEGARISAEWRAGLR